MRIIVTSFVSVFLSLFSLSGADSTTAEMPLSDKAGDLRILLVSSTVRDSSVLAEAAADGVLVVRYEARETSPADLVAQVRVALGGRRAASVGFVTHDHGAGRFYLCGEHSICLASTLADGEERAFWRELGELIEPGGRIDIFACDLTATDEGRMLVAALADAAGVDVAASSNSTGNQAFGGDWVLESAGIDIAETYFVSCALQRFTGVLDSYEQKVTASDATSSGYFGYSVSMDGDWAIVGALGAYAAYMFHHSNGIWSQQAKLTPSDGAVGFGSSVSIDGDYAIVGALYANSSTGAAYIFHNSGGVWNQQAKLTDSGGASGDHFGDSVSISGDYAIVGAPDDNENGDESCGSASVFYKDYGGSVDSWGQQAKLTASNRADYFVFGSSVSISGDYAVVGSPWCLGRGSAYIFYKDQGGTDNWGEQAVLTASDAAYDDYFGSSVSISGNYVFSGAPGVDNGGSGSGAAYIFVRSGSSWSQQSKLTPSDPSSSAGFGNSASVCGDYAIIGASGENSFKGSAYIYHRSGTMWTQQAKLTASDGAGSDRYGNSVTISSDYALVGASHDGDGGSHSGSAYFYLDEPTISSPTAQVTGFSSAVLGATNYIGWKGGSVSGRGVVWSTDAAPTLSNYDGKASASNEDGEFNVLATGLLAGTTYHYRAYATTSLGTVYTDDATFTTWAASTPNITDPTSSGISSSGATLGANVISNGGSAITERGVVWSTSANPSIYNNEGSATSAGTTGTFTVSATGLMAGTTYHYRGYASNAVGISYTTDATFATSTGTPTVSNPTSTNITYNSATLGATVVVDGGSSITQRGVVWSTSANPTTSSNLGSATASGTSGTFSISATGLTAGTTFHFRGYATNANGTAYTADATFTAGAVSTPSVSTPVSSGIGPKTATLGATVESDNGATVTARGVVWSTAASPTLATCQGTAAASSGGVGAFTVSATGLKANTTYYFRGYATNSAGTSYSADGTFTSAPAEGSLQVTIKPTEARNAGAAWKLSSGTAWRASGYTEAGLTHGNYTVVFKQVDGWVSPENRTVAVENDGITAVVANYTKEETSGNLTISFASNSAILAGARWRIKNDANATSAAGINGWHESGASISVEEGTYVIEFLPVPGWIHLATEVTLVAGKEVEVEVEGIPFLVSGCTDFDGDGCGDIAVFNPTMRVWTVKDGIEKRYGLRGSWPTAGDYDGDGCADLAYWSPKKGTWRVRGQFKLKGFGDAHDIPVPADYDGDGKTDTAIFNIETRTWRIDGSADVRYGRAGELPVPGDYDGDGSADLAMVDLGHGTWRAKGQFKLKVHCEQGHVPLLLDYDGDGIPEPGYYCFEEGRWHVFTFGSGDGHRWITEKLISFGDETVVPLTQGR